MQMNLPTLELGSTCSPHLLIQRCSQAAAGKLQTLSGAFLGEVGSLELGQCEVRSWQVSAVLPLVALPTCAWWFFVDGRECFSPLTAERRGNLRHVHKQKIRISYTTFSTKSSITWNCTVGKQAGHLGHCFLVLHKGFICSEVILNFLLEASLNIQCLENTVLV